MAHAHAPTYSVHALGSDPPIETRVGPDNLVQPIENHLRQCDIPCFSCLFGDCTIAMSDNQRASALDSLDDEREASF